MLSGNFKRTPINVTSWGGCLLISIVFSAVSVSVVAQKDSSRLATQLRSGKSKLLDAIRNNPHPVLNEKSESYFQKYKGKIIRKIIVRHIGFEKNIIDTSRHLHAKIVKTANSLHTTTKESIIRDNLFVHAGEPLNPFRVADNERYLRNLDFILDSRIYVKPVVGSSDHVDLIVVTRDVFSLGVVFLPTSASTFQLNVEDANILGTAQKLRVSALYGTDRSPNVGYDVLYQKTNILGTFVTGSVGYTQVNTGSSVGYENEEAIYFRLNRPLFHPFTRWAGGMELSWNSSNNSFRRADSVFAAYRYRIEDIWAGYSFGHKSLPSDLKENRNRKFFALRRYDLEYSAFPSVELNSVQKFAYRDRLAILGQLTFFRQDFFKTQYILGFGRTEDVPYGYRISATSGWETELGIKRLYTAAEVYLSHVTPTGHILTYSGALASYWNDGKSEDGLLALNFTRFSKVYTKGRYKIRAQTDVGYANHFNAKMKLGVDIRDVNGIQGFRPDTLVGFRRITLGEEAFLFTPWTVLGFHIAPLARIDLAMLSQRVKQRTYNDLYSGISGGVRIRNENLIFNTIELRVYYFPRVTERVSNVNFNFAINLQLKYPTTLVTPPSTVYNR